MDAKYYEESLVTSACMGRGQFMHRNAGRTIRIRPGWQNGAVMESSRGASTWRGAVRHRSEASQSSASAIWLISRTFRPSSQIRIKSSLGSLCISGREGFRASDISELMEIKDGSVYGANHSCVLPGSRVRASRSVHGL